MALSFYIFLASLFCTAVLIIRRVVELKLGRVSSITRTFERIDSRLLERIYKFFSSFQRLQAFFSVGILLHSVTVFLVAISNIYTAIKKQLQFRLQPVLLKIRGKREVRKDEGSLYVRDMLEYKNKLER